MTKSQLQQYINEFFSDTSRPQHKTKEDMLDLIDFMQGMADSLEDE